MDGFDIAVIGMAGRFPGSPDVETFWRNLASGKEAISFFTSEEASQSKQHDAAGNGERVVNAAGVIEGVDLFDAEFFGYSPREAELMDPQQRLFLEYAWIALERAGYDPLGSGAIGVFAGASLEGYLLQLLSHHSSAADVDDFELMLQNNRDFLTTRVSYKLNLKGPSINIQTACSTSLVAVHCACTSLLNYHCDMALAGGVSVRVPRQSGYVFREGMIFSPDGHCRAFDASAQGTVPGEGLGIVVLKRLDDALADRDHIHAVIKGGAVNNDGFQKVGFTAPSEEGQMEAIVTAQALAGFEPDGITFIETHGTGTRVGDPIEIAALRQAFASRSQQKQFCAIGALKTNIGHLDAAAGVAGLIKTIHCLEHRMIPPTLHYKTANPQIELEQTPFYVNTELRPWESLGQPRRAGVSSFGFGGTNAHLVLEEAAQRDRGICEDEAWHVLPLSTRTASRLNVAVDRLVHHLEQNQDIRLGDVAFTLQTGRHPFEHRVAVVCNNKIGAIRALRNESDEARRFTGKLEMRDADLVFMFPGEGSEYSGMGRRLYETQPVFRQEFDCIAELLQLDREFDLMKFLYVDYVGSAETGPRYLRLSIFAVSYALAKLWLSWGLEPASFIGHGIGEHVAACLRGTLSLSDALSMTAESENTPSDLFSSLDELRPHVLLEVGPGETLAELARDAAFKVSRRVVISSLAGAQTGVSEDAAIASAIARLWTCGVRIDWKRYNVESDAQRVSLPTYPFDHKRYWVESYRKIQPVSETVKSVAQNDLSNWFHFPSWNRVDLHANVLSSNGTLRRYLIFCDDFGVAASLIEELRRYGKEVITVKHGSHFSAVDNSEYVIDTTKRSDYQELMRALQLVNKLPTDIIHCLSVDGELRRADAFTLSSGVRQKGFDSLVQLSHAFAVLNGSLSVRLLVVSNGLFEVTGGEVIYPQKATIVGPCKVMPQEFAGLKCQCVDIGNPLDLGRQLTREALNESSDSVIAYRQGHRWIQSLQTLPLSEETNGMRLRENGVYLITGGLGGVGMLLGEYLARNFKARLVLVSRNGSPSVDTEIRRLEQLGAQVLVGQADVSDPDQLGAVLSAAREHFGKINGVIHVAGALRSDLIVRQPPETADEVFKANVDGTMVLHRMFEAEELDFFLLWSSVAALIGGVGQATFAAASAALDAYAHSQRDGRRFTCSINWPFSRIETDDAMKVMLRVLALDKAPQVCVSPLPLEELVHTLKDFGGNAELVGATMKEEISKPAHGRPELTTPYAAPQDELEKAIAAIWSDALGVEDLGRDDDFFELGGDSLVLVKVISQIKRNWNIEFSAVSLFELPTIARVAEEIRAIHRQGDSFREAPKEIKISRQQR